MIPKQAKPGRLLPTLSVTALTLFFAAPCAAANETTATLQHDLAPAEAAASEASTASLQRNLGALIYLMLPLFFYLLMRGRRRRPNVAWLASRSRSMGRGRTPRDGY